MNYFSLTIASVMIALTVFGDWLIKLASKQDSFSGWKLLLFGCLIYGLTGIGWFFVMREIKLSSIGVIYGVGCLILLAIIGVFYFKENLNHLEIVGLILGAISILILARFA